MRTIELIWDEQSGSNYYIREAFNTLRANILFSGKDVKTILVTSCYAHEGKSLVSFDLCRNLAESGKSVLLVDADLRKSVMVSRHTKERGVYGLSQILSGQVDAQSAVYHTNVERMDIVFAGPYPPNPTELVGSAAFKEFLDGERDHYDYIIIDAAPLGLVIDAAVMGSVCDGAVLVINIGNVKYRVAQGVKNQLEKSGCKILGVVLNQVSRKRSIKAEHSYYAAYSSPYGKEYGAADVPTPRKKPQAAPGKKDQSK
ncbi:MAG: polysaccharide biosynthesis tyrosine autokinase [Clostridia bacterium]|nr:polysaccharide biosynthesis tyrosine autokinase [Clostridia bacterium]